MGRNKDDLDGSAKRFFELKQQIVAATGLPSDAPRVSYLATLTLQAERVQSRVIADDAAELLALRTTMEEDTPGYAAHGHYPVCRRHAEDVSVLPYDVQPARRRAEALAARAAATYAGPAEMPLTTPSSILMAAHELSRGGAEPKIVPHS